LRVEVLVTGYHEPEIAGLTPADLASFHAVEKLRRAVHARRGGNGVPILAADTVVDVDGASLGKPRDAGEAASMLERLSGRDHYVHTAFALAADEADWIAECATTRVRFYPLEPPEIAAYVATGEPFDKAGGYGIQGRAASMIERIDGDFYTVMGLPLARVIRAFRRLGFALPDTNER
jgi:septum formation protein